MALRSDPLGNYDSEHEKYKFTGNRRQTAVMTNDISQATVIKQVSAEAISFSAGAAGTTGTVMLGYSPVADTNGANVGSIDSSSFAFVTGTVLTTEVDYNYETTDAAQLTAMSNGDFAIEYVTGKLLYKKATTGTSDTCNYKYRTQEVSITAEDIEIGAVEIKNAATDDRALVSDANTARAATNHVLSVQQLAADGTVPPSGSLVTNAAFVKPTDGTTVPVVETAGTKKALNVNITDGTNDMPTMDALTREGFVKVSDGTTVAEVLSSTHDALKTALTDGTNIAAVGTGTTKCLLNSLHDGTTLITFGTGTVKTVPSAICDGTNTADVLVQDTAFGTAAKGFAMFGKYQATPTTYTDNDAAPILLDANGRVVLSSDIEIGGVELKDGDSDNRANIKVANTARTTATIVMATQEVGADGTVPPTGSLLTNAPFVKITDAVTNVDVLPLTSATASTGLLSVAGEIRDFDTSAGDDPTPAIGIMGESASGAKPVHIAIDDSAMDATPPFLPMGGEYRAAATTYTDGDATVLQTDVNGYVMTNHSNVAHDSADSGNPSKIGGKASAAKPTAVTDGDRVNAYFDTYGRQHVYDEGSGGVSGGGLSTYVFDATNSLGQGQVAYTAATQVTVTGLSFTPNATTLVKIEQYTSAGAYTTTYTPQQYTITYSAGVYTIAGVTLDATGLYVVYQQGPERTTNLATNSQSTVESNGMNWQVVEESLVDTTNVAAAATYYPSSLGMSMLGYKNFSLTGKYIDGDATTTTLAVQATNDEDTTNGDWIPIQGQIQGISGTVTGTVGGTAGVTIVPGSVCTGLSTAIAQTMTFAWDFDCCNYRYIRVVLTPGDATNTSIIKCRRSAM